MYKLKFEYKISDWESFNDGYLQHKNLLSSSKIEFEQLDSETINIFTTEQEFNNWHLAELGRFYGSKIFKNNYELILVDEEKCNLQFVKPEKPKTILIKNKWNKSIEFKIFYLNCAEAYQTNVLANSLSILGVKKLNKLYPELNLEKKSFKRSRNYAYQIIDDVLLIISYNPNSRNYNIDSLYKTQWYEK